MSYKRHIVGKQAEESACHFLLNQGLSVIKKNYCCRYGEIDLIMRDGDDIVFVEVRLRHRSDFGSALESINTAKIRKLTHAATHFLQREKCLYKVNSRFDIITFQPTKDNMNIEWIKNILI